MRKLPINLIKVVGTLFGLLILVLILNPFYQVPGGYAGVKTDFGAVDPTPLSPGLHFALPIAQSVSMVSTQPHTATSNEAAATLDQQEVTTSVAVTFHVPINDASNFYTKFRNQANFVQTIIVPSVSNDLKAVTTQYNAQELITKREIVDDKVDQMITQSLAPYHVVVDAVNIANFQFSPDYMRSIEEKQIAQQKAFKSRYILEQKKIDAQQKVVTAKADAEAAIAQAQGKAKAIVIEAKAQADAYQIKSASITPQILKLQAIQQWNGKLPKYIGSGNPVPFLQSGK